MPKLIDLPDGSRGEFPDDMSDDAIRGVLRQKFPAPQQAPAPAPATKRFIAGIADPGIGIAQIADRLVVNPIRQLVSPGASSMDDYVRDREAGLKAEGVDWARMGGNVASPVNYVLPNAGAALPVAARGMEAVAPSALRQSVGSGIAQGLSMPVQDTDNFWTQKGGQAAVGGAAGVGGHALAKSIGQAVTPTTQAKALMEQGVQPTVGQAHGGVLNTLEQKLTSVPFVGDAVNYARNRASKEFEQRVLERVAPGAKNVDEANAYASKLYDDVVPSLRPTKQMVLNIQDAERNALNNPELTDQGKQILSGLVQKHFANAGQLVGPALKNVDSELGYLARKYAGGDPASRTLADEIYNLQQAFRTGLESGLPADLQGKLQVANKAYRELIPINKAASSRADERVMPRALQKAMARQQRTDVTRMRPDELVDSGVAVLPSSVPDSGTAGRVMLGAGGLVGSSALGMLPAYLGAGAGAYAGAQRPVQKFLTGGYGWQPEAQHLIDALRRGIPTAVTRRPEDGNE